MLVAVLLAVVAASAEGEQAPSNLLLGKRHDVYIAGFFPYDKTVPESHIGRGVMPAVKLAVDHINENPSVLRNHLLHMWWNDTQCNAAVGMKALFDMIHEGPHKLMLFGAACTQVTDPIAKASKQWKLTQLSYADTHPMFEPKNFPNFFRMVPSENAFNPPRLKLLEHFNWTRVGTIYQNEPRYSLAHNKLVAELDSAGMDVVEAQSFSDEVTSALTKLQEKDVRIILGNFNESWAREIFCEAYRIGIYGKRYQWLIMGTYSSRWWSKGDLPDNCTLDALLGALEGAILTDLLPLSTDGGITVSGQTPEEYRKEYDSRRGDEYSRFHGYTYDGVWTVALAIQHVARRIRVIRKNETMEHFRYRDQLWETLFLKALANTSFEGVTGPVRFYNNERKASIMLKQFQAGKDIKVGEFNGVTGLLDFSCGGDMKWIGKKPPKDRTLQIFEHSQVNLTVYIILAATACAGIVLTITFLSINIMYRNQRYIKMSSPYLNNLIIIGCMLTYTSVVFLGLDSQLTSVDAFPYICTARAWLLMSGFSLAFGSMFSKTWRVHSIFTDVSLNKKVIKDYQLFMVVGVLVGIDLAIMTTWQVADPFYRETKEMEPYPHPNNNDDVIIIPVNEYCQSNHMTIFVGTIYAYKGLLMIFGAFLAWETRHVSIPALNDSKYVGMSVYNVVIMCVMGAAISFVLSDKQDASFLIISVFIIFCTTATLFLVFVPKLVELRRNPQGVIDNKTRATLRPMAKSRRDSEASELEDKMKDAKQANSKYRKQLLDIESELQGLARRLGAEASSIVAMETGGGDCLSVPLLKREPPSGTETTDISSLCSLNSSQDGEDHAMDGNHTPGARKKSISGKRATFEDDAKQESILRKDQKPKARFSDDPCPAKNVSFGPPKKPPPQQPQYAPPQPQKPPPQPQYTPPQPQYTPPQPQYTPPQPQYTPQPAPAQQPPPTSQSTLVRKLQQSEQSLEKLGITQIHPRPQQSIEDIGRQLSDEYYGEDSRLPQYLPPEYSNEYSGQVQHYAPPPRYPPPDLQKLEEKIQEVTSHLTTQLLKRHDEQYGCESLHRRSSVKSAQLGGLPAQLEARRTSVPNWSYVEKKNSRNRRPVCRMHGYIESVGSDLGSDHDLDGVKFIDKNDYWVCQPERRGSGGGLHTPHRSPPPSYLLKDTLNNHSSPNVTRDSAQSLDCSGMQRSVSERGSRGSHDAGEMPKDRDRETTPSRPRSQASTARGGGRLPKQSTLEYVAIKPSGGFNSNLTHVLSTPDVGSIRPYYDPKTFSIYGTEKRKPRKQAAGSGHLCTAVSEGELLDLAILPIFQKLLTERHKSRTGYGSAIASCPNISIKCDIVEYL